MPAKDRLDEYFRIVSEIILSKQNPVTGLIPASTAITSHGNYTDAWVRDNVYSILAVWGLALAYRRIDDDRGRGCMSPNPSLTFLDELEHATIKCMRGLLFSMMRQSEKVEQFKNTQSIEHSLHAKYDTATGATVVGDFEWGHLQIDATSIFLLFLAQMTASGLRIIYTLDEVHFVQNLVFYIERAYRIPDYGIWERGNKINHGMPELNSSSIGMAAAALHSINGINLFGGKGGPSSVLSSSVHALMIQQVIHVLPDEIIRNYMTLLSALPRESNSKEIDAAILSVISFPAFTIANRKVVQRTKADIVKKLGGKYGFKRFLRDGHQTVLEDTSRLHYEPHELKIFEDIECEWPLFFTYMVLDGFFDGNIEQAKEYMEKLDAVSVCHPGTSTKLIPELYVVPKESIEAERANPGSQIRLPNENLPLVWAQSLSILGNLMAENLLSPAELDPLGRRLINIRESRSTKDIVVQVVLLSESSDLQTKLATFGLETQTVEMCEPVTISNSNALRDALAYMGHNKKFGLTGRPKRPVGTLTTCKIYRCRGRLYAFLPHFMDQEEFYLVSDNDYLVSTFEQELAFIKSNWQSTGRPTLVMMLTEEMMKRTFREKGVNGSSMEGMSVDGGKQLSNYNNFRVRNRRNLLNLMMSLRTGKIGDVRVRLGKLNELISTSCIESLDFISSPVSHADSNFWHLLLKGTAPSPPKKLLDDGDGPLTPSHGTSLMKSTMTPRLRSIKKISKTEPENSEKSATLTTPLVYEEPLEYKAVELIHPRPSPLMGSNPSVCTNTVLPCVDPFDTSALMSGRVSPPRSDSILTFKLEDPKYVDAAIEMLRSTSNIYDQIDLLQYLHSCLGLDHVLEGLGTVSDLIEEVYSKAVHSLQWSVVRQAAGLLQKTANSLLINITDLIIRQKPMTIGFGKDEYFIYAPMSPAAIAEIIFTHREAPLVMEILTCLGSFIRSRPTMFEGITRLRLHFLIIAMREEISRMRGCNEEDAIEYLMQMSPFEVQSLLGQVLTAHDQANINADQVGADCSTQAKFKNVRVVQKNDSPKRPKLVLPQNAHNLADQITVSAQSAGFSDGNFVNLEVIRDGQVQLMPLIYGRGLNVIVIDPFDGLILECASFDTYVSREESDEFARLIDFLEPGTICVVAVQDEAFENLTDAAKEAIVSLGSARIGEANYRDSWCIIGEKGAAVGTVPEDLRPSGSGPTERITLVINMNSKRKNLLSSIPADAEATITQEATMLQSNMTLPSNGRWLRRRKNDGALNRVTPDFYPKIWHVLSKCEGIVIGSEFLPRDPTIMEKTPEEFNFALQVEHLLDAIRDPAERQTAVECLSAIYSIGVRNSEMVIKNEKLDILDVIKNAVNMYWDGWVAKIKKESAEKSQNAHGLGTDSLRSSTDLLPKSPMLKADEDLSFEHNQKAARRMFFDLPSEGEEGTMTYLARSSVKLVFEIQWSG